ncbi:MAG: acetate kinase [Clostridia bacterium]
MIVLVVNAGSSSVKYQLIDMKDEKVIAKGNCERIGISGSFLKHKANGKETIIESQFADHNEAIKAILDVLISKEYGVIVSLSQIDAIGHRVVHGEEKYSSSVIIDEEVMKDLVKFTPLAPLHMPANINGILACQKAMAGKPNVAVFDTAFHSKMPKVAFLYGVPYKAYTDWKIRRYGFHGTSHKFVANEVARVLNEPLANLKVITVHLGNGSSIAAVKNGVSIDTSMGFTPLEGLIMGTRCGDLDPSVLEYISSKTGWDLKEITNYLNKKSGILGLTELTSDMREIESAYAQGNEKAALVIDMIAYRIKKYIGSYSAIMGGVDAIVFTGGIGENMPLLREKALEGLEYLGIEIDKLVNNTLPYGTIAPINSNGSKVQILRIPTNEELMIARDTKFLVTK